MQLRFRHDREWSPVTIAETVRLKPGQRLDLGPHQILPAVLAVAEVLNSAGLPVEGVPVQAVDRYGTRTSNTDEEGIALFYLGRDSRGEFVVEYKESDEPGALHLRQATAYELAGVEDANTVYTLRVSDELVKALFR